MPKTQEELDFLDSLGVGAGKALGAPYISGAATAVGEGLKGNIGSFDDLKKAYGSGKDQYDQYANRANPYAETVGGFIPDAALLGGSMGLAKGAASQMMRPKVNMGAVSQDLAQMNKASAPSTSALDDIIAKVRGGGGGANADAAKLMGNMDTYKSQGLYKDEAGKIADWIGGDKNSILKTLEKGAGVDPAEETLRKLLGK